MAHVKDTAKRDRSPFSRLLIMKTTAVSMMPIAT